MSPRWQLSRCLCSLTPIVNTLAPGCAWQAWIETKEGASAMAGVLTTLDVLALGMLWGWTGACACMHALCDCDCDTTASISRTLGLCTPQAKPSMPMAMMFNRRGQH